MGSSPSSEVKVDSPTPGRRVASVSDFRSSNNKQSQQSSRTNQQSQNPRPKRSDELKTAASASGATSSGSVATPSSSSAGTAASAPRVIRGGRADAIPEVRNAEDIVFETFYHENGRNYTCMYANNTRYYLDSFQSGDWKEFPMEWYGHGTLDVDDVLGGSEPQEGSKEGQGSSQQSASASAHEHQKDSREGVIKIPGKGVFQTYIFEHRRNVHSYFDPDEGAWIKLPLRWELKTDVAKHLVRQTQELCPQWRDECDLLASLRASNYNVEDCVNTFHATQGTYGADVASGLGGGLSREKSVIQQNDNLDDLAVKLSKAEQQLERKQEELESAQAEAELLKAKVAELEEQVAGLETDLSEEQAKSESLQRQRPVSAKVPAVQVVEKETVSKKDLQSLHNNVRALHKAYLQLVTDTKTQREATGKSLGQLKDEMKQLKSCSSATQEEIEEVRTLYRRETLQRKLLYNQLQELRGNIRVFCRMRNDKSSEACITAPSDQDIVTTGNDKKKFQFDKVFGYDSSQDEIYAVVSPIITSCADGYNVSIMAYGQTGSGKTYTMLGPSPNPFSNPGVNVRAIKELFKICGERKDTTQYDMHLSMVEIYNECVQDLLRKDVKQVDLRSTGTKVTLVDITEMPITKEKDILDALDKGTANRKVAATKMNSQSSRSHLVLILTVIGRDLVTGTRSKGTLTLCDLAGSERVSKTGASGEQLAEAAFINKSLTSLGQVFAALRDNQLHIPYRNSKLTHLLMPSLGGDAKACLFVNVSPLAGNKQETLSTLLFGVNARQVALGQAKKNVIK